MSPQSGPEDSPSPAPKASPSPKGRGPKPSPADRGTIAWQEPPPLIPSATPPGKPEPSPTPASRQKSVVKAEKKISTHVGLVSESGSPAKERATPSPSASPPPDGAKVCSVWGFHQTTPADAARRISSRISCGNEAALSGTVWLLGSGLASALKRRSEWMRLPIDVRGTVFQFRVWTHLQSIPYGEVQSYSEVARGIHNPAPGRRSHRLAHRTRSPLLYLAIV